MSEKELIGLKSFKIDLNKESSFKMIFDSLTELKKKGYNQLSIDIKTSPEQELKKSKLDGKIFSKIKETQELPDWVVINFMQAAGKLKNSSFKDRFKSE